VIETTFAEETETDLFGEQAVLCGGVSALVKAAYENARGGRLSTRDGILRVHARAEVDCRLVLSGRTQLHALQRFRNTAEYGDYTRGPRIVTEETKKEMKKILNEIQTGQFAREWMLENKANAPAFKAVRRRERQHPIEEVGRKLRRLMSWINSKEV